MTERTKPVAEMTQAERAEYAADGDSVPDGYAAGGGEMTRWVFVPDLRVDALRRAVFGQLSDEALENLYRRLSASYRDTVADRNGAGAVVRTLPEMIAWWEPRAAFYPLVFARGGSGRLDLVDGCHRLHHFYLTRSRETVPALIGVPIGDAEDADGGSYAPECVLRGTKVTLRRHRYQNDRPALQAYDEEGPYATLTVNLPGAAVGPDEAFFKNWSENEGFLDELEAQGVVRRTGRSADLGYVRAEAALILV